jgi:hypothetical protein
MLDVITEFLEGHGFDEGAKPPNNPTKLWSQASKLFSDDRGRMVTVTVMIPCREDQECANLTSTVHSS